MCRIKEVKDYLMFKNIRSEVNILAFESGGCDNVHNCSTIICGARGEPLVPFEKPCIPRGVQAKFLVESGFQIAFDNGTLTIVKISNKHPYFKRVFQGAVDSLPKKFNFLREAIEAALKKADCYMCNTPHYIL